MADQPLNVNFARLKSDIEALSSIGRSSGMGISRTAFSDADMQARGWLQQRIEDAGLEFFMDGAANLHGRLNWNDDVPAIMTGSHIDTVPGAGHLDGALGVMCGLEALRVLKERGEDYRFPLEVVAFSDEEGTFSGMFGSQALTGDISPEWIHSAHSADGLSLIDAMQRHGLDAMQALGAARPPESIHAFVELHIEQGPVLDSRQTPIGVVEGICGLQRWEISLLGTANHAGTTPMEMREDAFLGLAEFAGEIERVLHEHGGQSSVATIGRCELSPGAANVVPGEAHFTLEFRDISEQTLLQLADAFHLTLSTIALRRRLMFEFKVVSDISPVACDTAVQNLITSTADELGLQHLSLASGAAHDTQKIAAIARAGMIFVPSKAGRSHSAAEWTSWNDIEAGANVLLNTLYKLTLEERER